MIDIYWDTFKAIVIICLISFAAWYFTQYMAKAAKKGKGIGFFNRSENIKIVDNFAIAKDKQLLIVVVSGRAFLLGVSSEHIDKLEELDLAELKLDEGGGTMPGGNVTAKFKSILNERFGNTGK